MTGALNIFKQYPTPCEQHWRGDPYQHIWDSRLNFTELRANHFPYSCLRDCTDTIQTLYRHYTDTIQTLYRLYIPLLPRQLMLNLLSPTFTCWWNPGSKAVSMLCKLCKHLVFFIGHSRPWSRRLFPVRIAIQWSSIWVLQVFLAANQPEIRLAAWSCLSKVGNLRKQMFHWDVWVSPIAWFLGL